MNRHIPNRHRGRPDADLKGDKLYRDMTVRVIMPGQKDILWRSRAGARRGYTLDGIQTMLEQVAEHLEKRFPSVEFRMVELKPNVFNFCYEGRKNEMEKIQTCPEVAQSVGIATALCAVHGHDINTFQNGMVITQQGQQMQVATYCKKCGFGLSEIRGEIEKQIQAAVQAERLAQTAQNKPQMAGKGPVPVPPADSPSEPAPE